MLILMQNMSETKDTVFLSTSLVVKHRPSCEVTYSLFHVLDNIIPLGEVHSNENLLKKNPPILTRKKHISS